MSRRQLPGNPQEMTATDTYLTPLEVAEMLRFDNVRALYRLSGLRYVQVNSHKRLYRLKTVERWLREHEPKLTW